MSDSDSRPGLLVAVVPCLLLVTPFIIFVRHHAYGLGQPEILACLLLLVAIGCGAGAISGRGRSASAIVTASLIAIFIDVQFDFDVPIEGVGKTLALCGLVAVLSALLYWTGRRGRDVVGLMTAGGLLTTFLVPAGRLVDAPSRRTQGVGPHPFILHLILDEHIGMAGLRAAGAQEAAEHLSTFLESRRFRIFDRAYSQYTETVQAIGHALDLDTGRFVEGLVVSAPQPFAGRVTRSRYLEWLTARGYTIDVYQADHLDFCHSSTPVASCLTYASTKLGVLQQTPLSWPQRASVVLGAYAMRSDIWHELREHYRAVRQRVPGLGRWLPDWDWERTRVSPIATAAIVERLEHELSTARRGQVIVAHLLLPHYPYVYDASCGMRPPNEWRDRNDPFLEGAGNTPAGRALRYRLYADQLACLQHWIARLLDAIPEDVREDALIILQGDHGSRIGLEGDSGQPGWRGARERLPSDDLDFYSALFAVRGPALETGHDNRQSAVPCLLAELVRDDFRTPEVSTECESAPTVSEYDVERHHTSRPLAVFPP